MKRIYDENNNLVIVPNNLSEAQRSGDEPFMYNWKKYYLKDGGRVCVSKTYKQSQNNSSNINRMILDIYSDDMSSKQYKKYQIGGSIYSGNDIFSNALYLNSQVFSPSTELSNSGQTDFSSYTPYTPELLEYADFSKSKTSGAKKDVPVTSTSKNTNTGFGDSIYDVGGYTAATSNTAANTKTANASTTVNNMDKTEWSKQMKAAYMRAGASEQYANLLVGQDALESNWGKSPVGDYNYGNIKAFSDWKGKKKQAYDKREKSNNYYRSYNTIDDYAADKIKLLKSYDIDGTEDVDTFISKLTGNNSGKRKYATSSSYGQALRKMYS